MKKILTFTFFFGIISLAFAEKEIAFIGIHGENAPAVEKTFDRLLREHLSVMPEIKAADYIETQRYANLIRFNDFPTVSRNLVAEMIKVAPETTLFVWGTIKEYHISPVRKYLFGVSLEAKLTIGLTMYSLADRTYAYAGNVKATVNKPKGFIFMSPVDKVTHITALDRTELLEKLVYEAVRVSGQMIGAVAKTQNGNETGPAATVEQYKVPSISDVFAVPSVEARSLDQKNKPDTTSAP